jgi:hypothetical protein
LRLLEETCLSPEKLELEVTGSVVTPGVDLMGKVHALEESDIGITIGDSGAAPSSLSYR